ncbi:Dioxygenase [Ekhidna lutea]|uniref:Dioxygenase n=1 Tax=Ekhidna lutea TaxID=447679 RepID=A0A239KLD5_EKHLU|nr:hypothetical protein [Ekhidna lutea]SNT19166.1 Dioxygenase [Ekhidna lutea]
MPKYLILLLLVSCGNDRIINSASSSETSVLKSYKALAAKHKLQIVNPDEPGEKLTLCLTFVEKVSGDPHPNQKVHFYHTDTNGEYMPTISSDESTARLNGTAFTDESGRILVQTILPGDYGSSSDNRHIHTTVFGAKPEAYDIHFKQYTGFMGTRFAEGSDQHFLADLKRNSDGSLIAFLTIATKNPFK